MTALQDGDRNKKLLNHPKDMRVYTFSLPAIKTCPCADKCKTGCYGTTGRMVFKSVREHADANYQLAQSDKFVETINAELDDLSYIKKLVIRIHPTGDFFKRQYLINWAIIAMMNPDVTFYAYTKSVSMVKSLGILIPDNLIIAFSFGGLEDNLIDVNNDKHVVVIGEGEPIPVGYIELSDSDLPLYMDKEQKKYVIRYHGTKKYDRTSWAEVVKPF